MTDALITGFLSLQEKIESSLPGRKRPQADLARQTIKTPAFFSKSIQGLEELFLIGLPGLQFQIVDPVLVPFHPILLFLPAICLAAGNDYTDCINSGQSPSTGLERHWAIIYSSFLFSIFVFLLD